MALPKDDSKVDTAFGGVVNRGCANNLEGGCISDLMICTYDESHVVSAGRYFKHLTKCAERNAHMKPVLTVGEMHPCPYDKRHQVHNSVLHKHIAICEGYFKFTMGNQEDPPSMKAGYGRYKFESTPKDKEKVDEDKSDKESDSADLSEEEDILADDGGLPEDFVTLEL